MKGAFHSVLSLSFLRDPVAIYLSHESNMEDCSSGKVGKGDLDNTPGVTDRELRCGKDVNAIDHFCKLRRWFEWMCRYA